MHRVTRRRITASLSTLALLLVTGTASTAASAAGPTAIGVDSAGVVYVGFATGGEIKRYAGSDGAPLSSWGTAGSAAGQIGGVVAIDVAPGADGNVWVLDTNRRVQEFTRSGTFVRGIQLGACAAGVAPDPLQRGGLDVTTTSVFVAHPCSSEVYNYRVTDLGLNNQSSPTGNRPKGVSGQLYDSAPSQTRRTYIAYPTYDRIAKLQPWFSTDNSGGFDNPYGFKPVNADPTDVFIDAFGVLFVSDRSSDRVTLYDQNGSEFRWIGGSGTDVGRFNDPVALDVFEQFSDLSGNVFVADHGNERIQRLNPFGFTFWAASATAGGGGPVVQAPVNTGLPVIGGGTSVGQAATCSTGTWSNSPTSFAYQWNRNGVPIPGANGSGYTFVGADAGQSITCTVTATNSGGSAQATSASVTPAAAPQAPAATSPPVITGSPVVGQNLVCQPGTWTGTQPITTAYSWNRNGVGIPGATFGTYTVQAADVGQAITCVVVATNSAGSTAASSTPVFPTAAPSSGPVGVTINDKAKFTNSPGVTLTIRERPGASSVLISNDGSFDEAVQQAVRADDTYTWTLDSSGSDRLPKHVYVRFLGMGDENQTFSDDIVLDETAALLRSATLTTSTRTLRISSTDRGGSGVSRIQLASTTRARKPVTRPYRSRSKLTKRQARLRYVRVVDRAGNVGKWKKIARKSGRPSRR
jgi:hypothetical protein